MLPLATKSRSYWLPWSKSFVRTIHENIAVNLNLKLFNQRIKPNAYLCSCAVYLAKIVPHFHDNLALSSHFPPISFLLPPFFPPPLFLLHLPLSPPFYHPSPNPLFPQSSGSSPLLPPPPFPISIQSPVLHLPIATVLPTSSFLLYSSLNPSHPCPASSVFPPSSLEK